MGVIIDILTTDTALDLALTDREWQRCLLNKDVVNLLDDLEVPIHIRNDLVSILDTSGNGTVSSSALEQGLLGFKQSSIVPNLKDCQMRLQEIQQYLKLKME